MEDNFQDMIRRVWNHAPCKIIMVEDVNFESRQYGNLYINRSGTKAAFGDLVIPITQEQLLRLCVTASSKTCEYLFELSRRKHADIENS